MSARTRLLLVALAAVVLPLVAVAVVLVERYEEGRLTPEWALLAAGGLAIAVGVSVAMLRVFQVVGTYVAEVERSRVQLREALHRLGGALEASTDRTSLVELLVDTTCLIAGADIATFHQAAGSHLEARAARGMRLGRGVRLAVGEGVAGAAVTGGALRWPPATGDPAIGGPSAAEPPADAALAVPVVARGRVYGVLAAYRERGKPPFTANDLDDVVTFAHQAEAALENTFLQEETRRLSLTDGLTSVWNRRQFDLRCAQEVERAHRFGEPFAVLICDLDDFKSVNDRFYHAGGDSVLVEFAQRLVESTREVDFVGRYGGEEFVLILPRTEGPGAEIVAEHIRSSVADTPFETGAGLVSVTVSIGIACHPDHGDSRDQLVEAADVALFAAKAAGKNAVRVADTPRADALHGVR